MNNSPSGFSKRWHIFGIIIVILCALPLVSLLAQASHLLTTPARNVFTHATTYTAALRTVSLGLGVGFLSLIIALPLAWLTSCTNLPQRNLWRILLTLPLAVPSYVSGFVIMATFSTGGWLHSSLLEPLGISSMPDIRGGIGATLALLSTYPLAFLTLQAALTRIDPRTWEAARSLGSSPWQAGRRVILPLLRPAMATSTLLVGLYAMGDFGAVSLLRYKSLSYIIYLRQNSLSDTYRSESVFLGILLVTLAILTTAALERTAKPPHASLHSQSIPWPPTDLGRWKIPALAFCTATVLFGLVLPVGVVLFWLIRGLSLGHSIPIPWDATAITLLLSTSAALLLTACAIIPATVSRFSPRASNILRWTSNISYSLPAIVVALAFLSFATSYAFPLYQSVTLLFIAYTARFLPLTLHSISDSLRSQNPSILSAARSLGCTPAQTLTRVVLPNAKPAIWAGLIAIFIAVIKELPITLLLSPIDITLPFASEPTRFRTLATHIWTLTADEYFSEVAPVVLILLTVAFAGILFQKTSKPNDPS